MEKILRLTVLTGSHKHEKFCLRCPGQCLIGRHRDCLVQLNGTERDQLVSRRHCEVVFEPMLLRLRDLASLNGTYFNGQKVDKVELALGSDPDKAERMVLKQGDLLTVGGTTLMVDFVDCPAADEEFSGPSPVWENGQHAQKDCPMACAQ